METTVLLTKTILRNNDDGRVKISLCDGGQAILSQKYFGRGSPGNDVMPDTSFLRAFNVSGFALGHAKKIACIEANIVVFYLPCTSQTFPTYFKKESA